VAVGVGCQIASQAYVSSLSLIVHFFTYLNVTTLFFWGQRPGASDGDGVPAAAFALSASGQG
jgi:hypothetical protein